MLKTVQTTLEIDLNALAHNYRYISSNLKKGTRIMAVVKAFGYGSEAVSVAKELIALGVDYFAVAYAGEGEALRDAGIETPILVLHPLPSDFEVIVCRCMEPSMYSQLMLSEFMGYAEGKGLHEYPVHIKFNTGLNRLGFLEKDIQYICKELLRTRYIKARSIFSHLAASEDPAEQEFTLQQLRRFQKISEEVMHCLPYKPLMHILNTSGVLNYPEAQFDMVRTGIGLYGFGNDSEENKNLHPVASLKTVISQLHDIKKGETVGYNMGFTAQHPTQTATLPLGHADGISRAYGGGKGWVAIHGKKAPIIGNVCMDMIMVDVTGIACKEGDEVVVFGDNPTAEALSAAVNSIPYELLTAISQRVKRIICRN